MKINPPVDFVSKSPVGSSKSKISGEFANALDIATLYYSPPDNSEGFFQVLINI